jgi:hypothetical protein
MMAECPWCEWPVTVLRGALVVHTRGELVCPGSGMPVRLRRAA